FRSQLLGPLVELAGAALVGGEDELHAAAAVPQVHEEQAAVVAGARHPPGQDHFLAVVLDAQGAALMGPASQGQAGGVRCDPGHRAGSCLLLVRAASASTTRSSATSSCSPERRSRRGTLPRAISSPPRITA